MASMCPIKCDAVVGMDWSSACPRTSSFYSCTIAATIDPCLLFSRLFKHSNIRSLAFEESRTQHCELFIQECLGKPSKRPSLWTRSRHRIYSVLVAHTLLSLFATSIGFPCWNTKSQRHYPRRVSFQRMSQSIHTNDNNTQAILMSPTQN